MFFSDPVAAFTNIGARLRPGGRLALLAWRELARNEWLMALRAALAVGRELPDAAARRPDAVLARRSRPRARDPRRSRLRRTSSSSRSTSRSSSAPTPTTRSRSCATMGIVEGLTHDLDDAARAEALDELRKTVVAHDDGEGVLFGTSAWLITARRP